VSKLLLMLSNTDSQQVHKKSFVKYMKELEHEERKH
jgi:hypothetical protein